MKSIERIEKLDEMKYPWLIISKTNEGRILKTDETLEGHEKGPSFYEAYFSGLKGPMDFFPCPVNYLVQREGRALKVIEEIPFCGKKGYKAGSKEDARIIMSKLAKKQARFMQEVAKKQMGQKVNLYFIEGKLDVNELGRQVF